MIKLLTDAAKTSRDLFKIMIPVTIAVKILTDAGLIGHLGAALEPLMRLVGLPGSSALAWATAMGTNIYGGLLVFLSAAQQDPPTAAQTTIFTTMVLIAHTLPLEVAICRKAGARSLPIIAIRVLGAFAVGIILNQTYQFGGWLQEPSVSLFNPQPPPPGLSAWAINEIATLLKIFVIIMLLLLLMRILHRIGAIKLLNRLLLPLMRFLGIGPQAAPLTIIGMTLGISYGGGLIIQESKSGRIGKRDVFLTLALLSLAHSLIEDTTVMALAGGRYSGLLVARLAFALPAIAILAKLLKLVPDSAFDRFFFAPPVIAGEPPAPDAAIVHHTPTAPAEPAEPVAADAAAEADAAAGTV